MDGGERSIGKEKNVIYIKTKPTAIFLCQNGTFWFWFENVVLDQLTVLEFSEFRLREMVHFSVDYFSLHENFSSG